MSKFIIIWSITSSVISEVLLALEDKKLDAPEIMRILRAGLQGARIGLSYDEVHQIHVVNSKFEMEQIFEDGDGALIMKKPVLDKLSIEL